jgi:hypothetical protein
MRNLRNEMGIRSKNYKISFKRLKIMFILNIEVLIELKFRLHSFTFPLNSNLFFIIIKVKNRN